MHAVIFNVVVRRMMHGCNTLEMQNPRQIQSEDLFYFYKTLHFRYEFLSINERPGLPLRKYGMLVYKHLFFNGFCVIYFWVCFIFPRWLGRKLM